MSVKVTMAKTYQCSDGFGVQVWFSDGASVRFDGFNSVLDARKHVENMWGVVHVVVD